MLSGTADVPTLMNRAPTMASLTPDPLTLDQAEVLQAAFEMPTRVREAVLPPGLHPTNPALLVLVAWSSPESPWGPFTMVQARVSCRSGVRPRGFVVGCITDNPAAADSLRSTWGVPAQCGKVHLSRYYDGVELTAACGGVEAVRFQGHDPEPLDPGDVQYTVTMTLAATPRGPRLVQLEPEYHLARVERLRPRLSSFDAAGWGEPLLEAHHPVAATIGVGSITLPRPRYVCRPDILAFEGTEPV